jgi:hypothetical protein
MRVGVGLLEHASHLGARLAQLSGELLVEAVGRIAAVGEGNEGERMARLGVRSQPEDGLTYARLLTKDDTRIDWGAAALAVHRRVMGLYPGAQCQRQGQRMKLLATEPLVQRLRHALSPQGQVLADHWGGKQSEAPGKVLARCWCGRCSWKGSGPWRAPRCSSSWLCNQETRSATEPDRDQPIKATGARAPPRRTSQGEPFTVAMKGPYVLCCQGEQTGSPTTADLDKVQYGLREPW